MTKEEFRKRWDSDDEGGGITFDDIVKCAQDWGIYSRPRTHELNEVVEKVIKAAGCRT